jgi:uncharacterized membrane protein
MARKRLGIFGLLAAAALATWLLWAAPPELFGIDTGQAGVALLVTVAWVSLYAISRIPRSELEKAASPAEWKARVGFGFMFVALVYLLANMESMNREPIVLNPPRNLVMLLIAWIVLSWIMRARWKGEVQEDERDRDIAALASGWGRGALVFCVIAIAVTLGLSPAEKLAWATPLVVANMLVLALIWSSLFEHAAAAVHYWRDRH